MSGQPDASYSVLFSHPMGIGVIIVGIPDSLTSAGADELSGRISEYRATLERERHIRPDSAAGRKELSDRLSEAVQALAFLSDRHGLPLSSSDLTNMAHALRYSSLLVRIYNQ